MEKQKISRRAGYYQKLQVQTSRKNQKNHERVKSSSAKRSSAKKSAATDSFVAGILEKLIPAKKYLIIGIASLVFLGVTFLVLNGSSAFKNYDPINLPQDKLFSYELNQFLACSEEGMGGSDFNQDSPFELLQLNPVEYTIKNGDTIYELAKKYNVKPQTLVSYNNITNTRSIYVGQTILIPDIDGIPYKVKNGDSLLAIANKYGISINNLLDANNLQTDVLAVGQQLFIPGAVDNYQYKRAIGKLILWPVSGRLTSRFGYRKDPFTGARRFHFGIDIANRHGTRINSAIDGKVVEASKHSGFGNYVVVEDRYGLQTYYAHLSKISVRKGQRVKQGQKIGEMGTTGRSTGDHLHFAVYKNGKAVNPMNYLH